MRSISSFVRSFVLTSRELGHMGNERSKKKEGTKKIQKKSTEF